MRVAAHRHRSVWWRLPLALSAIAITVAGAACRVGGNAPWRSDTGPVPAILLPAPEPGGKCRPSAAAPKRQLRGVWIATVSNSDWPSRAGLPVRTQQREYVRLLDAAQRMRLNVVFVQIRPHGDAFYPSPYEPWSAVLTGQAGRHPGYDPLAFLVREAHRRGLEFHAWFNPYRASDGLDRGRLPEGHPARTHPEWTIRYGENLYYDPGHPQARRFITRVVLDVVHRYDVDGVHFDDYFYPYPEPGRDFADGATYRAYGDRFAHRDAWRRHNVDMLIEDLSARIHRDKPWVRFGISPFGIWRNSATDPRGSDTTGLEGYDALHADTRRWVREGWVDYIAPQLYWSMHYRPASYAKLVRWWSDVVDGTDVQLYVGQAAYRVGENGPDRAFADPDELPRHLIFNRRHPNVRGDLYFNASALVANPLGFADRLARDLYRHPALIPEQPGGPGEPPDAVRALRAERTAHGLRVAWNRAHGARSYAVYRIAGREPPDGCAFADGANLIAVVPGGRAHHLDTAAKPGRTYQYYVTPLNRQHLERPAGSGIRVTVP